MCSDKKVPVLLGAAVEPCPGTWDSLESGGQLAPAAQGITPQSVYSHPACPEHRTTCVFLTALSSKHQTPCGPPVHPCMSLCVPPQPGCYLLFALPRSLSHCPIRLLPVFPPSRGICPLEEPFFRGIPSRDGRGAALCKAVLRAAAMSRQSSPIIPVPAVHGELSLFSSFSAAEISSGCCQGYLHPPACSTLCCSPVPPRAGARPRPGSTGSCSGAPGLYSPIANNKLGDKIRKKINWGLVEVPRLPPGHSCVLCSLPHADAKPEPGAAGRAGARCLFLIKLGPRREPRSASPAPDDNGGEAAAARTAWYP
ncbi:uncharacterized protein LOC119707031 [Motacilla alba alba]|uniref:uncharacterized protein LOC119707031 n=1 Tax=Motacilla alba alba TaxID=1094192 RepID=UPI0018D54196|nr:uncharacterized protein LOC119707031 [Motacilla alba alba]